MLKNMKIRLLFLVLIVVVMVVVGVISGCSSTTNNNINNEAADNEDINNDVNNDETNSNVTQSSNNSVIIGGKKFEILGEYQYCDVSLNKINGYGLYKIGDEYVFKGGDNYIEVDNEGNTSQQFKQGYLQNIVKFNNNYWRIVKVNEDGSIKLIYYGTYNQLENRVSNNLDLQIKYIETISDNFTYENSFLREYLNNTILNDDSIIPSNYTDYLVKTCWDISNYDIYSDITSEEIIISNYEDYVGILSVNEYSSADYCYQITTGKGYKVNQCTNYITNILDTAIKTEQLKTNTSNIIVDENGKAIGVAKIERNNGEYEINTEYNVDTQFDNNVLPVITLKPSIKFSTGDGTIESPFIVE